jgi:hypothetical protein
VGRGEGRRIAFAVTNSETLAPTKQKEEKRRDVRYLFLLVSPYPSLFLSRLSLTCGDVESNPLDCIRKVCRLSTLRPRLNAVSVHGRVLHREECDQKRSFIVPLFFVSLSSLSSPLSVCAGPLSLSLSLSPSLFHTGGKNAPRLRSFSS